MTPLLYVYYFTRVHLRAAVTVGHGEGRKSGKHIKTRKDTAVLLDRGYIPLYRGDKLSIYPGLEHINLLLCPENLLLIFLKFLCYISFSIYKGLLSYPFRRHLVLGSIAHLKVISENGVETNLKSRYPGTFRLTLLQIKKIVLSVTRQTAQLVQFGVYPGSDYISLSDR